MENLNNSFPDKSIIEKKLIAKKFYRHFCDIIVESVKSFSLSEESVKARVVCANPKFLDNYFDQGKDLIITGGHYNNWEIYAIGSPFFHKHKMFGIYKPLSSKFFDQKMRKTREKFGFKMVAISDFKELFYSGSEMPRAFVFAIDQSPSKMQGIWLRFLNQDSLTYIGAEKYARENNLPVVAGRIEKPKRGHYLITYYPITETPTGCKEGEIIELASKNLEEQIIATPEFWLWTHRRWKKKKPIINE